MYSLKTVLHILIIATYLAPIKTVAFDDSNFDFNGSNEATRTKTEFPTRRSSNVENFYKSLKITPRWRWTKLDWVNNYDEPCYNYFKSFKMNTKVKPRKAAYRRQLKRIYQGGRIIIHHTATSDDQNTVMRKHIRKFGDLGYHFYINKKCQILEGRPLHFMGINAGHMPSRAGQCERNGNDKYKISNDFDFKSIGIVMEGNTNKEDPKCKNSLKKLVQKLSSSLNINRIGGHNHYRIVGHTDCPGDHLKKWLHSTFKKNKKIKLEGTGDRRHGSIPLNQLIKNSNGKVSKRDMQVDFVKGALYKQGLRTVRSKRLIYNDTGPATHCSYCQDPNK